MASESLTPAALHPVIMHAGATPAEQLVIARQVLWHFGDTVLGYQPGSFVESLLRTFGRADQRNFARLFLTFPEFGVPAHAVMHTPDGLEELRSFVKAAL